MFTDSVRDAAHRAGFVKRGPILSPRTALRVRSVSRRDLNELAQAVVDRAGSDPMLRYQLLPPDIVDRDEFVGFWNSMTPAPAAPRRTKPSGGCNSTSPMEFGLQSRTGRTLELTEASPQRCIWAPQRATIIGRRAVDKTEAGQHSLTGTSGCCAVVGCAAPSNASNPRRHPPRLARPYIERTPTAATSGQAAPRPGTPPTFPKAAPRRSGAQVRNRCAARRFRPHHRQHSWYAIWASRCLDVSPHDATFHPKALFAELTGQMVSNTIVTESGSTVYGMAASMVGQRPHGGGTARPAAPAGV